ncbi:MAG: hypothetical protein ACI4LE_04415 [Faecalibacterium sp.]
MIFYEEPPLVPGLPGVDDVTDGSVDYFEMDWENVENGVTEEEMQKCCLRPCTPEPTSQCLENQPEQTDDETYEMILE